MAHSHAVCRAAVPRRMSSARPVAATSPRASPPPKAAATAEVAREA
ncbi:hypothetical protein [Streptomyces sp. NPDC004658]